MNPQILPLFPFFSLLLILIILVPEYLSSLDEFYRICGGTFSCGMIGEVGYPFRRDDGPEICGYPGLVLHCDENITTISILSMRYHVLSIDQSAQTMKIVREDVVESTCPLNFVNTTLDLELFDYVLTYMNLTFLYGCPAGSIDIPGACLPSCANTDVCIAAGAQGPGSCNASVVVPVSINALGGSFNSTGWDQQAVREGFEVRWKVDGKACRDCTGSKGICGHDPYTNKTACYCPDPPYLAADTCSAAAKTPSAAAKTPSGSSLSTGSEANNLLLKIGIGAGFALIGFLLISFIFYYKFYYKTRKSLSWELVAFWRRNALHDKKVEAFILQYGASTPKRYRYSDIKRMTHSFKDKLGQGGYGIVFKGKLADNRLVAVKVLNASKGNGEEFMNEVASIGRTSHVNIVTLLGFCYEGRKRALIYEFMPNGSLDKFIYENSHEEARQHLGVEKLYEIALGIARGLEYLHFRCNTRILHLDIKPHNILLDADFCPKIADFGLAKLFTKKKSNVSMLEARGTIGYIAPEVLNRNLGGVSHKSDAYSYGMMVIEMVGGRKNVIAEGVPTSEIYLPYWIYKRLERHEDLQLQEGSMTLVENEIARKMILVGLWCIQTDQCQRPSMNKVIEMLEGSLEALEVPPRPFSSSSPTRPTTNTSTTF